MVDQWYWRGTEGPFSYDDEEDLPIPEGMDVSIPSGTKAAALTTTGNIQVLGASIASLLVEVADIDNPASELRLKGTETGGIVIAVERTYPDQATIYILDPNASEVKVPFICRAKGQTGRWVAIGGVYSYYNPILDKQRAMYFGRPTEDGSWRMGVDPSNNFVVQKLVGVTWITKTTLS